MVVLEALVELLVARVVTEVEHAMVEVVEQAPAKLLVVLEAPTEQLVVPKAPALHERAPE